MLEKMLLLCEEEGLRKPACYQGDYNLITRGMETKLLPLLRSHGMTYNAFRCVAPCLSSDRPVCVPERHITTGAITMGRHVADFFDRVGPLLQGS